MRCQLSVGEKTSFLYIYKNTNLWNDRNRSVVFRDLDYLNLCTIKRQGWTELWFCGSTVSFTSATKWYRFLLDLVQEQSGFIRLALRREARKGFFFLREQNSRSIFYLVARSTYLHVEITFYNWKHRNFMVHWGRKVTGKNSYRKI